MEPTFTYATINDLPEIVQIYNQTIAGRKATADLEPVSVADRIEWFKQHNAAHPTNMWDFLLHKKIALLVAIIYIFSMANL